jgi:hypothetical protein
LVGEIEAGIIKPVQLAYRNDGSMDPIRSIISVFDLAELASERGEKPRYLRHLMADKVAAARPRVPTPREKIEQQRFTIIKKLLDEGIDTPEKIGSKAYYNKVRDAAGNPLKFFSDKTIERVTKGIRSEDK